MKVLKQDIRRTDGLFGVQRCYMQLRGGVKKNKWYLWVVGAVVGRGRIRGPTTTFGKKGTTFCFCFHSMQKPSKHNKTY